MEQEIFQMSSFSVAINSVLDGPCNMQMENTLLYQSERAYV